jgi:hypothetical protein
MKIARLQDCELELFSIQSFFRFHFVVHGTIRSDRLPSRDLVFPKQAAFRRTGSEDSIIRPATGLKDEPATRPFD